MRLSRPRTLRLTQLLNYRTESPTSWLCMHTARARYCCALSGGADGDVTCVGAKDIPAEVSHIAAATRFDLPWLMHALSNRPYELLGWIRLR
eukprot:6197907-Pleurochrysis_carterae.AAC.2